MPVHREQQRHGQSADAASDNNIDFFDYDPTIISDITLNGIKASSTISLASTTIPYSYQPNFKGATSTKAVDANIIPSRYTRVTFTVASSTPTISESPFYRDGLNLWANFIGKIDTDR